MMIWSVYREEDGPFRAYKCFGDNLKEASPNLANDKLQQMAISIVRDRIANMNITDILQNRTKLRSGVKEEIQKLLTGWGMWLETCEIQDVKILSGSLFKNMQAEFREKNRLEAERIIQDAANTMTTEAIVRDAELAQVRREDETKR